MYPNNEIIRTEYKNYLKVHDKIIKDAKCKYDREQIISNIGDSRRLWRVVNNRLGRNLKEDGYINYIYDENKHKIFEPNKICNILNSYFCNVGFELSKKIQPPDTEIKLPHVNPKTMFITPTTIKEIENIIKNLKLKNGGVDNINTKTIVILANFISEPLAHIVNLCIEKAIWPDALKRAVIKPIHKGKDKHSTSNYRPISLISNLAKILEKIIHHRILNFIIKHKIISKQQYGFMKNLGTKDALNYITNLIYEKLDKSTPIAITFLDLAKAFDTVNHKILLDKLYNYGIRGKAHELILSYLQNRKQCVKCNDYVSDYCEINTGVPQGTVLGPLLFILYVNDLLTSMHGDLIVSFADDTAVISTDKTWKLVELNMINYLDMVSKWLALNQLSLNLDKTVFMTFGNYCDSVPYDISISMNGKLLKRVESCKYLGIVFDYRMIWNEHIEYILNKTKYLVFIFHKISKYVHTETLRMLYYAFFQSIISYGIIAWGGAYAGNLKLIQELQNKILKIVNRNHFIPHNNPLNVEQLFSFEALKLHYNDLKTKFINSNSITRNRSVPIPLRSKTVGGRSSFVRAIRLFNGLPNDLKILSQTSSRKTKLKKWIKANI